jgi:hypothetical protein
MYMEGKQQDCVAAEGLLQTAAGLAAEKAALRTTGLLQTVHDCVAAASLL